MNTDLPVHEACLQYSDIQLSDVFRPRCLELNRWAPPSRPRGEPQTCAGFCSIRAPFRYRLRSGLRKTRSELAGTERIEGAEASGKQSGGETPFAEEAAQEVWGRLVCFACIAFDAAGNEVAIGVAAGMHLRDDVVEAPGAFFQAAPAVEASVALAGVDRAAQ